MSRTLSRTLLYSALVLGAQALALLSEVTEALVGRVSRKGPFIETVVGFDGADFLNAAAVIDSDLDPLALDAWLHALEDAHGRDRRHEFGQRVRDGGEDGQATGQLPLRRGIDPIQLVCDPRGA